MSSSRYPVVAIYRDGMKRTVLDCLPSTNSDQQGVYVVDGKLNLEADDEVVVAFDGADLTRSYSATEIALIKSQAGASIDPLRQSDRMAVKQLAEVLQLDPSDIARRLEEAGVVLKRVGQP